MLGVSSPILRWILTESATFHGTERFRNKEATSALSVDRSSGTEGANRCGVHYEEAKSTGASQTVDRGAALSKVRRVKAGRNSRISASHEKWKTMARAGG